MNIIMLIGVACFTYLLTIAEPIIWIKDRIGLNIDSENNINATISRFLSCCLCLGFWLGITFTMSVVEAAIIAVTAEVLSRLLKYFTPI